jgi:hypothetical protein
MIQTGTRTKSPFAILRVCEYFSYELYPVRSLPTRFLSVYSLVYLGKDPRECGRQLQPSFHALKISNETEVIRGRRDRDRSVN